MKIVSSVGLLSELKINLETDLSEFSFMAEINLAHFDWSASFRNFWPFSRPQKSSIFEIFFLLFFIFKFFSDLSRK